MKRLCSALLLAGLLISEASARAYSDFGARYQAIGSISEQKKAFVLVLLPKIRKANATIREERRIVQEFFSHYLFTYNAYHRDEIIRLTQLAKKYRIKNLYDEKAYLTKIAEIPTSLVLAQAAVESAWGKSRFVALANNIFGVWTYGENGIVPEERTEGMKHKIRIYKDLESSIAGYMLNLNRNPAYKKFRKKRHEFYERGERFRGVDAADTMEKYSGIGKEYNSLLKKLIESNGFGRYDLPEGSKIALVESAD